MSFNTPQSVERGKEPVSLLFTPPYRGAGGDAGKGTPVLSHLGRSPSTTPGTFAGIGRVFSKGDQPSSARRKSLTPASSMAKDTPPPPPGDSLLDSPGAAGPSLAAWAPSPQHTDGGGVEDMIIMPSSAGAPGATTSQTPPHKQMLRATRAFQEDDDTWVTVFGFSQNDISLVLRELGKCGDIVHFGTFGDGPNVNWMHIQFANKHGAQRALLRNGDQLSVSCMVGVKPVDPLRKQSLEQQLVHGDKAGVLAMTVPRVARPRPYQLDASAAEAAVVPLASKSAWEKVSEFILGL